MSNTLISIYDDLEHAERARNELMQAGFNASEMHLSVRNDESGPVEGNFTVGNPPPRKEGVVGFLKSIIDSDDDDYSNTYGSVEYRSTYMLTIEAEEGEETLRACEITRRYGTLPEGYGAND